MLAANPPAVRWHTIHSMFRASLLPCLVLLVGCSKMNPSPTFVDNRDGKAYRTVQIGERQWMTSNLAYLADPSWCYNDDATDCDKDGRLYPWSVATISCPDGWRLPSDTDWSDMEAALGMDKSELYKTSFRGTDQGAKLRLGGESGFDAPISGYRRPDGSYTRKGERSAYWLSTEADSTAAWHRDIRNDDDRVYRSSVPEGYALSVRCVYDVTN